MGNCVSKEREGDNAIEKIEKSITGPFVDKRKAC